MGMQNRQKFRRQEDFAESCLEQRVPSLADVSVGTATPSGKTSVPPVGRRKTRIYFGASASSSGFSAKDFPFRRNMPG
jgi:hypothetical protein